MKHVMRARRPSDKNQHGQALWEMALGFTVLFMLLLGVIEIGKVFYLYQNLLTSARMGARYLASHPYTIDHKDHVWRAKNLVVYGKTSVGAPQVPGLKPTDVEIVPPLGVNPPQFVTVRVNYQIVPFSGLKIARFRIHPEVTLAYLQSNR